MSSGSANEDYLVGNMVDSSTVSCSSSVQSERLEVTMMPAVLTL